MKLIDRIKERKELKEKLKLQGKRNFFDSVGHAIDGIDYTVVHEKNFKIELIFAILVCLASVILKLNIIEWVVILLTIAMVLVLEVINTAIERCVDLVTKEYQELAKIAKDAAAGAVLIMSMFSVCIGICIFLPKLIKLLGGILK